MALYPEQGLKVEPYRKGRARPDGALAPLDHFVGQGEWAGPDGVLMTVEVTSHDRDTDRRDRREKRDGYASADIPVCLLVDRDACTVTVYSDPEGGTYRSRMSHGFGDAVRLPDPVGINLETQKLKDYTHCSDIRVVHPAGPSRGRNTGVRRMARLLRFAGRLSDSPTPSP